MTSAAATPAMRGRAKAYARDAAQLAERGDLPGAEAAATFALALDPDQPIALRVAGRVQRLRGHFDAAERSLRAALVASPDDSLARCELAACLSVQGQLERAIDLLRTPAPKDAVTWFELGVLLDRNADAPGALDAAKRVLRLAPAHSGARFLSARALTALGQTEAAAAHYRDLTRLPAEAAKAWFALLDLKTVPITPADIQRIELLVRDPNTGDEDRMLAGYALGQAYEQAKRAVEAVRAFDAASRLRRKQVPWNADAHTQYIDSIQKAFAAPADDTGSQRGSMAVFILGMPRSGTTLIEQILAAHPHVAGAGELPFIGEIIAAESQRRGKAFPLWVDEADADDWQRLGEDYLSRTTRWQTALRFTDKLPENWPYVGAIARMLPGARIVGCERDLIETAWSCYKQLFAPGRVGWSYDIESLAAYCWDSRRLWQHFQRTHASQCHTQSYEAMVADFDSQVRDLLEFIGLDYDPAVVEFRLAQRETRTASAAQVRQPLNRSTARRGLYGAALDPLADALRLAERRGCLDKQL